jgi:hypothetical protein
MVDARKIPQNSDNIALQLNIPTETINYGQLVISICYLDVN